ncbi:MAG: glutaredoxin family protein [Nitrospinae bacterium]|nr:glutaredoxin family protein [Nitrospinota bacterium]
MLRIEIYTKEDCHLCESAKEVLNRAARDYPLEIIEIDITRDEEIFNEFKESIPVVFINKKREFIYKVHEVTLRKKLDRLLKTSCLLSLASICFLPLLICLFFLTSCSGFIGGFKPSSGVVILHSEKPDTISIKKVAVIPFRTGSLIPADNGTVICHLTGQSFKSGKIEADSGKNVASLFYNGLLLNRNINLIPEANVNLFYESMDKNLTDKYDISLGKKVGETLDADAVLMGVVLRYEERDGTSWAANRPASAAFTAILIDVKSGEILWKVRFDKTQKALSENILDIKTFMKGGGSWQTADQLLSIGIEEALKSFPLKVP